MKKYFSYLSMALIAFVFASCGLKGNHTSSGRAYELLVVVDHGVWDRAAGRALHARFGYAGVAAVGTFFPYYVYFTERL